MRFYIHREGRGSIAWVSVLVLLLALAEFCMDENSLLWRILLIAGVLLWMTVLFFFRIPERNYVLPKETRVAVAPADGKVVDIADVEETEYFKGVCTKVSIFMSPVNVHVNRYPVSGEVVYHKYHPGKFLVAWHEKSSHLNERNTVVVRTEDGVEVLVRQIAGAVARRIVSYAEEGQHVEAISELGFIKFGSRVDLFFPTGTRILVDTDQKVKGGITRVAEL